MKECIFLIKTADRKGLLAEITAYFYRQGVNILQCRQYTDLKEGAYFMRLRLDLSDLQVTRSELESKFAAFAETMQLEWSVHYSTERQKVAIMVSKTSHCLYDLLVHAREKDIDCEIPLIISNHPDLEYVADQFKVPYFCFPVTPQNKAEQEQQIIALLKKHHIDLVVMARYMQILSDDFINTFPGRIINIHHAFLPAFQGGNPYERAWERGVKMIGATAHYATRDLDEGQIIEQDVERISHESGPEELKRIGKEIERRVLSRAVRAHLEHRVIVNGNRTIVFSK